MPLLQIHGKGILTVVLAGRVKLGSVESGRLLTPRMERRFLTLKRVLMLDRVVVLGKT